MGPGGTIVRCRRAGQAWHWVDPAKGAAQAAAVLRPGGLLALFWNVFEPPADLAHAFSEVYRRTVPNSPFSGGTSRGVEAYSPILTKAVDGIGTARDFAEPEQWRFEWEWLYSRDEWLDFVPTSGGHSQLPPWKLDELLAGIGAAMTPSGGASPCTTRRSPSSRSTLAKADGTVVPTTFPGRPFRSISVTF